jgi:plastocyanin
MLSRHPYTTLFALVFLIGCGDTVAPPEPGLTVAHGDPGHRIFLRDQCGGETWTPFGGCLIDGPVVRPDWIARVQETGSHPLWAISPAATAVETGTTLEVVNVGGRPHSFTRVANFGGGVIAILNTREDTRVPAPECLEEFPFVSPAGGSIPHTFTGLGEQHYQCCFHPWMRTTVNVTLAHGN